MSRKAGLKQGLKCSQTSPNSDKKTSYSGHKYTSLHFYQYFDSREFHIQTQKVSESQPFQELGKAKAQDSQSFLQRIEA